MSTLLQPNGRVLVNTTVGDIEIELWSKECPKACRNLIALAMEGYYDGVAFHRVVPGFLVQTGDRTGTGSGGESFYGEPFEDETHPRLRWSHRGLVGCAGNGAKNTNDSQFFITLDRADELQNKNTLFGRVVGDTIYNVLKIGQLELDKDGRPVYPPKINTIRILENPFDDIVPRITAEEVRAQKRAKEEAARQREVEERRKGAKKDVKLLSFGDDGEQEEVVFKKKSISRPDLIDDPTRTRDLAMAEGRVSAPPKPAPIAPQSAESEPVKADKPKKLSAKKDDDIDLTSIREKHAKEKAAAGNARQATLENLEASVRALTRRRSRSVSVGSDDGPAAKKHKGPSVLAQELAKYEKNRGAGGRKTKGKGRREEDDVLSALASFQGRLRNMKDLPDHGPNDAMADGTAAAPAGEDEPGEEFDRDTDFLAHHLVFDKENAEQNRRAEADYEVIDPRARARWAKEEKKERRDTRGRTGRGR